MLKIDEGLRLAVSYYVRGCRRVRQSARGFGQLPGRQCGPYQLQSGCLAALFGVGTEHRAVCGSSKADPLGQLGLTKRLNAITPLGSDSQMACKADIWIPPTAQAQQIARNPLSPSVKMTDFN